MNNGLGKGKSSPIKRKAKCKCTRCNEKSAKRNKKMKMKQKSSWRTSRTLQCTMHKFPTLGWTTCPHSFLPFACRPLGRDTDNAAMKRIKRTEIDVDDSSHVV